jgi:hypothetical protein
MPKVTNPVLDRLVSRLTDLTRAGRLYWRPAGDQFTFRVPLNAGVITINRNPSQDTFGILVRDPDGVIVDQTPDWTSRAEDQKLAELFDLIVTTAKSRGLENIIAEIESLASSPAVTSGLKAGKREAPRPQPGTGTKTEPLGPLGDK